MLGKSFAGLLLVLSTSPLCAAQAALPTFEVATVRPSKAPASEGFWSPPGTGSFKAHALTLAWLIKLAYGVDDDQIANKPSWLDSDTFDITAKPSGNIPLSREQLKPMLQSLLQERFHLATHTETRPVPGYALTIAKGGNKLQRAKVPPACDYCQDVHDGLISGENWSMPMFATRLQHAAGRPVIDRTGLSGNFTIKLLYSADPSTDSALPSLFTAMQDTLGLKLEPQKIPVEVLLIDHADRTPKEN